jgi:hypothetical protein
MIAPEKGSRGLTGQVLYKRAYTFLLSTDYCRFQNERGRMICNFGIGDPDEYLSKILMPSLQHCHPPGVPFIRCSSLIPPGLSTADPGSVSGSSL